MIMVLDENMIVPINAKIDSIREEWMRLRTSKVWTQNKTILKNGRERWLFTMPNEDMSHTFDIDDVNKRTIHVFQHRNMLTVECGRFRAKKSKS